MKNMTRYFIAILLMVYAQLSLALTASLSHNAISINESFTLVISYEGVTGNRFDPDLSSLEKDFIISNKRHASSVSIVNGQTSAVTKLEVELIAKREGTLSIPSIQYQGESTDVLSINVTNSNIKTQDQPAFVEITHEPKAVIVGQQINLTVKLYYLNSMRAGSLGQPTFSTSKANIFSIGNPIESSEMVDGRRMNVHVRNYVVFIDEPGKVIVNPVTFTGRLNANSRRHTDPFQPYPSKQFSYSTKAYAIDVKPRSVDYRGKYWIPAESLELTESWNGNLSDINEGDTITREITIQANGLMAESLPSESFKQVDSAKVYTEPATLDNRVIREDLIGTLTQSYTYLFDNEGKATLPELKLSWWDVIEGKEKIATLPAREIMVQKKISSTDGDSAQAVNREAIATAIEPEETEIKITTGINYWMYSTIFMGLLWLITLLIQNKDKFVTKPKTKSKVGSKAIYKQLIRACRSSDASEAKKLLLKWLEIKNNKKHLNFNVITLAYESEELKNALNMLNGHLYSKSLNGQWNGLSLIESLQQIEKGQLQWKAHGHEMDENELKKSFYR